MTTGHNRKGERMTDNMGAMIGTAASDLLAPCGECKAAPGNYCKETCHSGFSETDARRLLGSYKAALRRIARSRSGKRRQ